MKRFVLIVVTVLSALLVARVPARAQYYDVQVMIYNSEDKDENGKPKLFDEITIYAYDTEAEGRRAVSLWNAAKQTSKETGVFYFDPGQAGTAMMKDLRGTSWPVIIKDVSDEGALFITSELGNYASKLVMVKGEREFKVTMKIEDIGEMLDAAIKKEDKGPRLPLTPPVDKGDTISLRKGYMFPEERMGKPDARFALQTFIVPMEGSEDTLEFRRAMVMDGREYHATQLRRMGYQGKRDPLYPIAEQFPPLSDSTKVVYISDKIIKGKNTNTGLVMAKIWFEDYNHVYYREDYEVEDLSRMARPMQFLEYSLETSRLDPKDPLYVKEPNIQKMDVEMDLAVNFAVGKAVIDSQDSVSVKMLDSLRTVIYGVTHTQGSELKSYRIYGVSSPEGGYAKNVALALERLRYIEREVRSVIPSYAFDHMRKPITESRVATWEEFADTLAKDTSMVVYADEIRNIARMYPGSMDQQGAKIRLLPYYKTIVKDNLYRLRSVKFFYSNTVYRALTVDEMFDKFRHDPAFQKGGANEAFMPYEFWVMMQHAKDTTELETICRRAVNLDARMQSRREFRWPLPANILASSYLERGIADTTILAPFIFEEERRCNRPYTLGENRALLNPTAVVANQVAMMLRAEHFTRAMQIALLFKDSEDPQLEKLYAIARCKAGYFDADTEEGSKYYEIVRNTSPRNAVVMDLATYYLDEVPDNLDKMDQEDPVTDYLRAQYICIQYFTDHNDNTFNLMDSDDQVQAIRHMVACFSKDEKYIEKARGDWFIFKGLFENSLKEYREPGSVLEPEPEEDPDAPAAQELTQEEINRILEKGMYHFEELTPEEEEIYWKYSL